MFEHKYIKLFGTQDEYVAARDGRQFLECATAAIIEDRTELNDRYQYSKRTTNNDDQIQGKYNSLDDMNHYGGLEIIWGYWGWKWEDLEYNGEILKGGHMIKLKTTYRYPQIYDGYRLQHINNLTSEVSTRLGKVWIGHFDNSNIISANNAFSYGVIIDKTMNTWNVESCVNMFISSSENFYNSGDNQMTDLYLTRPLMKSGPLFREYYEGYPKLHYHSIESFNIGIIDMINAPYIYIGNPPGQDIDNYQKYVQVVNDDALYTCYDYTYLKLGYQHIKRSSKHLYFDINYIGDQVVIIPQLSCPGDFTFKCSKKWKLCDSILTVPQYGIINIDDDTIDNYNYRQYDDDKDKFIFGYGTITFDQEYTGTDKYKCPTRYFKKHAINMFRDCSFYSVPQTYQVYREGYNIPTYCFNDLQDCIFEDLQSEQPIVMTGFENYDNLNLTFIDRKASYPSTVGNIVLHLSKSIDEPKTYGYIKQYNSTIQYSYIIRDSHIVLTGDQTDVPQNHILYVYLNNKYENSKVCLDPDGSNYRYVKFQQYGIVPDGSCELYSNKPITLASNWVNASYISDNCEEIHMKGLTLNYYPGDEEIHSKLNYIYFYLIDNTNLRIVEMPLCNYTSWWRFDKAQNLDIPSLIESIQRHKDAKKTIYGLTINRIVYDKLTEEQKSLITGYITSVAIYENEE